MGAARARVLGFSNLELVAETAIDIVMPAIDTSIDHDAFAQQLRRANSSATLSPTVFLKRRSITQRKSLGKLLDNVVNRSIEVIKSPLKMHRARTQSFKTDDDGSGEIDINEFVDAVSEAKLDEAHARALFDKADKDGSGTLDVDEFVALVSSSAVLVNAFADILKAAAERRQRLEEQRLSTFFKQPPAISPTSGMRRRPSLSDMRNPHDVRLPWDAVLAPTAQGLVMGRV